MSKRTKAVFAIGLLGLLAVGIGVRDRIALAGLMDEQRDLEARAAALGIRIDAPDGVIRTKVSERFMDASVGSQTDRLVSLVFGIQKARHSGLGESLDALELDVQLRSALLKLPIRQYRTFLDALMHHDGLDEGIRREFSSFALEMLRERDFGTYLDVCLNKGQKLEEHNIRSAFADWGRKNPDAAVAWLKENEGKRSGIVNDDTKSALIAAIAETDPGRAFALLSELSLDMAWQYTEFITYSAKTPELRAAALKALRGYVASLDAGEGEETGERRGYYGLGVSLWSQGYSEATDWLEGAKLSQRELDLLSEGLTHNTIRSDHSKWFAWMSRNLSGAVAMDRISGLVNRWTELDYEAAGKWLAGAPNDDFVKPLAVQGYVEAVARFEPENAEQWALTLPDTGARDSLFARILRDWPANDVRGRTAFALRHGL
jgi:hypothetical protein